jgi:hypothetical protein
MESFTRAVATRVAPWVSIKFSTSITCEHILVEIMELNGHGGHVLESLR